MIAWLRSIWLNINASYWFFPALFSLVAIALSIGTVYLDRNGAAEWLRQFDWLHPSRPEGARQTLSIIAASMVGVAATVFSITIAAVAYASGNYGPRLLTNFMEDKGNQLSLATFIGTFVYALMVVRTVRSESENPASAIDAVATDLPGFTPQLSLLVAMVLALVAVAVLVYFLHHIPASIRINIVLEGIGRRLLRQIRHRFPDEHEEREPHQTVEGEIVTAAATGYIKIIDLASLDNIAKDKGVRIALRVRTGDFINPCLPLIEVEGGEVDDALRQHIRKCFDTGAMRTAVQDPEFLIDELVEICQRALSPGINDPFTAITTLHWMGSAMAELGHRDLQQGPEQSTYDRDRVQPPDDDYAHFLRRGFGAMRSAVATHPLAANQFVHSLYAAATGCTGRDRFELLREEAETLLQQARIHLHGPALFELEERLDNFRKTMAKLAHELRS